MVRVQFDILLKRTSSHQQQQIRTAAVRSVTSIAGGTIEQRARLRDSLLPRLGQASDVLNEVAATCLSRGLAQDLLSDGNFIQVFRAIDHEDIRVRGPVIAKLQAYIQGSDEAARKRVVDAGILQAVLQASTSTRDDLVIFTSTCVLPILGPALSQNNGGVTVFPLLTHKESRIRTAALQALKNGADSRHGNMENITKACIVRNLHPLTKKDDAVLDLWCHILPKAAPFLSNRDEIDILFDSLE